MPPLHAHRPNALSGNPLDRAAHLRKDDAWIAAALDDSAALFAPVWRQRSFVTPDAAAARLIGRGELGALPKLWAFLGLHRDAPVFAADMSAEDAPLAAVADGKFLDLRRLGGTMRPADAAILAHARGMMQWRARHRFCGVCGAACEPGAAGHTLHCTGCGAQHFPRTDPAVIMLVTCGDRALLGWPKAFQASPLFTTLAGFVEPGESLEEAVAREVFEEAGVRIHAVRYHSSQPWPFPASIMLGFRAEAEDMALTVDMDEILEARWFSREALRAPEGFMVPPPFSIARQLIDGWVSETD